MKTDRFLKVGNFTQQISENLFIKLRNHQQKRLPLRGLFTLNLENRGRYSNFTSIDFDIMAEIFEKGDRGYPYIFSSPALKIHEKISNK